ncbi:homoserine O-acetyltransferase [Dimargaris cristalligena]|uniref:Homoserine O-acetyltransferase n=1 Tax=Dimargaris cristalligena TaxID=215637 RepID=A0A4Q0A216_9FUNG|nr:homoserine O-acetyltransferase [Dimargaris cristalligena]|eukprot:RKP39352.1 homoserine O-acetyltransferase [Dimargaris cristalligena]
MPECKSFIVDHMGGSQRLVGQSVAIIPTFQLESGELVEQVPVAYKTWGKLNASKSNVMVICHAFTGSSDVSDWWGPLLGPNKAFDTSNFFIICLNVTGSPYGSLSPCTINPQTGKRYGPDFPLTTIRDDIRLHRQVLDMLGVQEIAICIGGSLGGMQVLEWAMYGEHYVRNVVVIATSARHSAWGISWGEAQRQAIYSDPAFDAGHYPLTTQPASGLGAARMSALLTYRTRNSFQSRFGRRTMANTVDDRTGSQVYSAQSYLRYQGDKFIKRFDANCYIAITRKMDAHDISYGRGDFISVLESITQPALIIGIESDGLFTINEQYEISEHLPRAKMVAIESPDGHDGFLLEFNQLDGHIKEFINEHLPDFAPSMDPDDSVLEDTLHPVKSSLFGEAETDVMKW